MSRTPTHRFAGRKNRNENDAVGNVSRRGQGSGIAGRQIADLLREGCTLMVVMTVTGEVFAVDAAGARGKAVDSQHPEWIVGIYTDGVSHAEISADLMERAKELRRAAA